MAKPFAERCPQARRIDEPGRILEDGGTSRSWSPPAPRASAQLSGLSVMRHGEDFVVDKPGMTSLVQLAEAR
jgi:hypothetical protein